MASDEGPRPFVRAYQITSRAVSASIGMVVPGLLGWWVDSRLGTLPIVTTLGFAFGLAYGVWRLSRLQAAPMQISEKRDNAVVDDLRDI